MKLIFGTTNKRKTEDLQNIINEMNLDIEVISMEDIGWDRGEIDENGRTIEENSLIKAQAILSFCQEHDILVQAWSPLARGNMEEHSFIQSLAKKYQKTHAQICLRFLYQKGIMPIVKSADQGRMMENMQIFDFELEREDMQMLQCMPQNTWQGEHPDFAIPKVKSNFAQ